MVPACPATRPVGLASARPTPWVPILRANVAGATTRAAWSATAPGLAMLPHTESRAGLARFVTDTAPALLLIRPFATSAMLARAGQEELAPAARAEAAAQAAADTAARLAPTAAQVDGAAQPAPTAAQVEASAQVAPSSVAPAAQAAWPAASAARRAAAWVARRAPVARPSLAARVAPLAPPPVGRAAAAAEAKVDAAMPEASTAVPMSAGVRLRPTRSAPTAGEVPTQPTRSARRSCTARVAAAIWAKPSQALQCCPSPCSAPPSCGTDCVGVAQANITFTLTWRRSHGEPL